MPAGMLIRQVQMLFENESTNDLQLIVNAPSPAY